MVRSLNPPSGAVNHVQKPKSICKKTSGHAPKSGKRNRPKSAVSLDHSRASAFFTVDGGGPSLMHAPEQQG
jgi:hypothetical protein